MLEALTAGLDMADYRMILGQGKQIVFEDERDFAELWKAITSTDVIEFDGEFVDGDDRYMGHVAVQREHIIALFLELSRVAGGGH
jgi:hypothetical protein